MELQNVVGSQWDGVKAFEYDVMSICISRDLLLGSALRIILAITEEADA